MTPALRNLQRRNNADCSENVCDSLRAAGIFISCTTFWFGQNYSTFPSDKVRSNVIIAVQKDIIVKHRLFELISAV